MDHGSFLKRKCKEIHETFTGIVSLDLKSAVVCCHREDRWRRWYQTKVQLVCWYRYDGNAQRPPECRTVSAQSKGHYNIEEMNR